jgi:hypothetical protein
MTIKLNNFLKKLRNKERMLKSFTPGKDFTTWFYVR